MSSLLTGLLFVALGAFAVLVYVVSLVRARRFVAASSRAAGEVIALRERPGRRGHRPTYAPVVRFEPQLGWPVEFTEAVSANPPRRRVGDRVEVLYRREDPSDARLASPARLYLREVAFAAAGSVFLAIGCALIYSSFLP